MIRLLLALLLALPLFGHATTYYIVGNCGTNSAGGTSATACTTVGASNSNNLATASNPATPWLDCGALTSKWSTIPAGSSVLFAQGSVTTNCNLFLIANQAVGASATNVITIGYYTPSWDHTTGCTYTGATYSNCDKPYIENTSVTNNATAYAFWFGESGSQTHQKYGPIIHDLHLKGGIYGAGVRFGYDHDNSEIYNMEIDGFSSAIDIQNGNANTIISGSGLTDYLWIHDNLLKNGNGNCLFGAANYMLFEGNTLDNCGTTVTFDHLLYIGGNSIGTTEVPAKQIVIRNNSFTRNLGQNGSSDFCGTVALIVHGIHDGMIIENNTFYEATPASGASKNSCWAIGVQDGVYTSGGNSLEEGEYNIVIRGNSIVNYTLGIAVDNCQYCLIENNSIYTTYNNPAYGILFRSDNGNPLRVNKYAPTNITARNNSLYFTSPGASTGAIRVFANENDPASIGSGYSVYNNLIYFASGSTAATMCFDRTFSAVGEGVTATNASPAVFTHTAHGMAANRQVQLSGTPPTGFAINTMYFVVGASITANTYQLSATAGGAAINSSSTGSNVKVLSNPVTFSNASPGVVTYTAHGLLANQQIKFANNPGTLPAAFVAGTWYFVKTVLDADTFTLSATRGGTAINTAGTGGGSATRAMASAQITTWDYNQCYYAGTGGLWDSISGTLAQWRTDSGGLDNNSITTDPVITVGSSPGFELAIGTTSPAKTGGHPTLKPSLDKRGCTRVNSGMGAHEYFAAPCTAAPGSPTQVTIQ